VHDRVGDEASAAAVERAGLASRAEAHPRDLSGGERQRLALELVLDTGALALACLDEPTRGMDAGRKLALAERLHALGRSGVAVLVATHDTEFAAELADRVVLMGQGTVIADGPAAEVLSGGWHFATETARVLGGAGGALTPGQGAALLTRELVR
jgi:energy-coupling factor transporter ATP-binding protein EcfA2